MSYIKSRGEEAFKSATSEEKDYSKLLASFKSGSSYKVKLIPNAYVEWGAHSVYKVFYTTPCLGADDLYCKASKMLYADSNAEKDEKKKEEIKKQANALRSKDRYLVAFYDIETKEQMIIDITKNQAKAVIANIKKFASKADEMVFELTKMGSSTNTTVSLVPTFDVELPAELKGKGIEDEVFENVLQPASADQQIKDLTAFGFDVSRLGVSVDMTKKETETSTESGDLGDVGEIDLTVLD